MKKSPIVKKAFAVEILRRAIQNGGRSENDAETRARTAQSGRVRRLIRLLGSRDLDWVGYLLLFAAGWAAGVINVIAGGGSFLTLPVLIFLGLPATVANGTNRLAVISQNVGAVWGFHRHRVLDWRAMLWAALPASLGAVLGTWAALIVDERDFQRILAFLMVAVTLWTLLYPIKPNPDASRPAAGKAILATGFFLVGIYGGFVQAGVGFLILAVTSMAGLDLVRGNAAKVLNILIFTVIALGIFAWQGKVAWWTGLVLAAGSLLGGQLGVRLTVLKGHRWVKNVVTITVILFAVKLWFSG